MTMKAARRDLLLRALRADRHPPSTAPAIARGSGIELRRVQELLVDLEADGLVRSAMKPSCERGRSRLVRKWWIRREVMQ